jgi:hypothetical protein
MAKLPAKPIMPLGDKSRAKLERLAKKSGKQTVRRLASGKGGFQRRRK